MSGANPSWTIRNAVASRVLVGWFIERKAAFMDALEREDLATVRKLVAGGATQLPQFETAYRQALQGLTRPATTAAVPRAASR